MKKVGLKMLSLFFLMVGGIAVMGQDRQDVPGDDFSLEGALELFKKSQSPEEFERLLNSASSKVNNLDLNGDGEIDYMRVIDKNEGNIHVFIIQAVISEKESQDVAVIELEKLANGKAVLQITGDEDVYGIETIIEPTQEVRVYAGTTTERTVINVWDWPSVQYVYSPYYSVWISPWHWHMRPIWWHSWSPIVYYDYYSYWQPYRPYYSHCHTHRIVYAHEIYRPHRTYSTAYYKRHNTQIVHYRSTHRDVQKGYYDKNTGRPTVRQRSDSGEKEYSRSAVTTKSRKSASTDFDKGYSGKRDERSYTTRSESTVKTNKSSEPKATRSVEKSEPKATRSVERSEPKATRSVERYEPKATRSVERSEPKATRSMERSEPRATQSVERTERSKPAGNSEGKRSSGKSERKN